MSKLKNKHLIGLEHTPADDIQLLIDTGFTFREVLDRPIKKVPSLIGKNIVKVVVIKHPKLLIVVFIKTHILYLCLQALIKKI